ncbi:penicillin-insensitive murein endopeptidase [Aurantimonas sp. MSK8Z-1]|uniref:penicillin-insensitive murein endopeptidase n=1 Tax=Mangrovibrevibacter kandeliae TaxID=2968473 RepID=UPI002117C3CA|nr:penicillin-insensitive murein endopeptidase [Aurantimonas sp. MSK8Z-1]MCW4115765.1 penicillin-insensitive murein endopeptidase [Aurantimonas sp. MSK8Z-1]
MTMTVSRRLLAGLALLAASLSAPAFAQSTPAKQLFSAVKAPSAQPTESIGFYAKGCLAGADALPVDGPTWQAMRLSRNRHFGTPALVDFIERLSRKAAAEDGWPGLLVGDMSQPRGGPLPYGHASHQVGLDADIWFRPMPNPRLSVAQRETFEFRSMLKKGTFEVDDRIWTASHLGLLKLAAEDPNVQRIFVNPGIKKKLCQTAGRDRAWLNKVRPYYGHDEHFHVRLFCQPGSPDCETQQSTGSGDGCDQLDWWFNVALQLPKPGTKPPKPKPPMTLADMPRACRAVLAASAKGSGRTGAEPAAESEPAVAASAGPVPPVPVPMGRPAR